MTLPVLIAATVFLITLWRREYGLGTVILLWPAYLIRTSVAGIPTTALELSIYGLTAAWVIDGLRVRHLVRLRLPRPLYWLMFAWTAAWILATAFSTDKQASLGALKAWLVDPALFGLVMLSAVRAARQRTIIFSALALSGAVVALAGLAQLIWFRDTLQDNRLSSFFHPVANYAAMYLGPVLVMTAGWLLWQRLNRAWWIAVGVMAVALALTVSFGGYLAVGVGALVLWSQWPQKKQRLIAAVTAIAVTGVGLLALSRTPYLSEKLRFNDRSSSLVRTQIWRTSWEMIKDRPWFGVGPNSYEAVYRATIPKLYFPPLEWLVSQPHQLYLALWLETGLLGLFTFVGSIAFWIRSMWPRVRDGNGPTIVSLAAMLAILAHGLVDTPLFKNDLAVMFVFVLLVPWLAIEK